MSIINDLMDKVLGSKRNRAAPGEGDLITTLLAMTSVDDELIAKLEGMGVSHSTIIELKDKVITMMADGQISKEEVMDAVKAFATEKGMSPRMLEKLRDILPAVTE